MTTLCQVCGPLPKQTSISMLLRQVITQLIEHWVSCLAGHAVTVCSYNWTMVAYINHQGGTRPAVQLWRVWDLRLPCQTLHIMMRLAHYDWKQHGGRRPSPGNIRRRVDTCTPLGRLRLQTLQQTTHRHVWK